MEMDASHNFQVSFKTNEKEDNNKNGGEKIGQFIRLFFTFSILIYLYKE